MKIIFIVNYVSQLYFRRWSAAIRWSDNSVYQLRTCALEEKSDHEDRLVHIFFNLKVDNEGLAETSKFKVRKGVHLPRSKKDSGGQREEVG